MKRVVLGVGDLGATADPGEILKTYALGSCVAIAMWDRRRRIAGMAHVVLPDSTKSEGKAKSKPGFFADTAVPELLAKMAALGCDPKGRGVVIRLAGGARMLELSDAFDIGKRNVLAVKKTLWALGLGFQNEDVGGTESRTVELEPGTGKLSLISNTGERKEL